MYIGWEGGFRLPDAHKAILFGFRHIPNSRFSHSLGKGNFARNADKREAKEE